MALVGQASIASLISGSLSPGGLIAMVTASRSFSSSLKDFGQIETQAPQAIHVLAFTLRVLAIISQIIYLKGF